VTREQIDRLRVRARLGQSFTAEEMADVLDELERNDEWWAQRWRAVNYGEHEEPEDREEARVRAHRALRRRLPLDDWRVRRDGPRV
jgi:hypothetical protein